MKSAPQAEALFEIAPCRFEPVCGGWVLVELGPVCGVCRTAFGSYLQPLPAAPEPDAAPAAASPETARWLTLLRSAGPATPTSETPEAPQERQNQRCWLCEERRTCIRTEQGWECRACRTIH